ncbi:MAG TPA: sulfatase-like hydrolase/transferase [Thermoanaerobaculia bacterium]
MTRRVCLLVLSAFLAAAAPAAPPNIVVFFMDDVGYADLRIDGAVDARTPNLDRLAREGVRLTDCYAAAPVCTPTRAAFMTGRYQQRVGLESVLAASLGNADRGLSPAEPTLPRYLHDAGYATGLFGKWHLGSRPEFQPNRHGFDEFFGFLGGALDYYSHLGEDGKHDLYENDRPVELEGYLTDAITTRVISFIERHAEEPFFVDVAYNATHWPFQPPGVEKPEPFPSGEPGDVLRAWSGRGTREDYVRMLERADEGIGRILATIDRLELRENTLVIFTSDNGGEWLSHMGPLFNRKGTLWEGGLGVPCVFRWPARLPGKRVSRQPAITMDLTATILAAAGATPRADRPLDGIDLLPILRGDAPAPERTFYWRAAGGRTADRAVREGRWKFVGQSPYFPGLLFDLEADRGERKDLAARHPEILRRLAAKHEAWERAVVPATQEEPKTGAPAPGAATHPEHGGARP